MTTAGEPSAKEALIRAIDLLGAGDWQSAHTIVQQEKSPLGSWLHGIVHILEGDLDNARGWYRRANRPFPVPAAAQDEIAAARKAITASA
jgi:hypothetical protein